MYEPLKPTLPQALVASYQKNPSEIIYQVSILAVVAIVLAGIIGF